MPESQPRRRAVDQELSEFSRVLLDHTDDEMGRYSEVLNKIDAHVREDARQHLELRDEIRSIGAKVDQSLQAMSSFVSSVTRAFPKDDEGKPDLDGHRSAHLAWISHSKDAKDMKQYIQRVVLGAAAVAVLSFVTVASWSAFIKGPDQQAQQTQGQGR